MTSGLSIFDAYARAEGCAHVDLANLGYFGVSTIVTSAHDGFAGNTSEALEEHLRRVVDEGVPRLSKAGIVAYAGLGIPAAKIPQLGLEALLARLPTWLGRPEVVALSGVGLHQGGAREEEVFARQCQMALELRLPVVVVSPAGGDDRCLRRSLEILRDLDSPATSVLVVGAASRELITVRALGFLASLGAVGAEEAASLVARLGPEGLMASSGFGAGSLDPLVPARLVEAMRRIGLSRAVVKRVAFENASEFYGVSGSRQDRASL